MPFGRKLTNEIFKSIMKHKCNWQLNNTPMRKLIVNNGEKNKMQFDKYPFETLIIPLMHSIEAIEASLRTWMAFVLFAIMVFKDSLSICIEMWKQLNNASIRRLFFFFI